MSVLSSILRISCTHMRFAERMTFFLLENRSTYEFSEFVLHASKILVHFVWFAPFGSPPLPLPTTSG